MIKVLQYKLALQGSEKGSPIWFAIKWLIFNGLSATGGKLIIVRTLEKSEDGLSLWRCPLCKFVHQNFPGFKTLHSHLHQMHSPKLLHMNSVAYLAAFWVQNQMCLRLVDTLRFAPDSDPNPAAFESLVPYRPAFFPAGDPDFFCEDLTADPRIITSVPSAPKQMPSSSTQAARTVSGPLPAIDEASGSFGQRGIARSSMPRSRSEAALRFLTHGTGPIGSFAEHAQQYKQVRQAVEVPSVQKYLGRPVPPGAGNASPAKLPGPHQIEPAQGLSPPATLRKPPIHPTTFSPEKRSPENVTGPQHASNLRPAVGSPSKTAVGKPSQAAAAAAAAAGQFHVPVPDPFQHPVLGSGPHSNVREPGMLELCTGNAHASEQSPPPSPETYSPGYQAQPVAPQHLCTAPAAHPATAASSHDHAPPQHGSNHQVHGPVPLTPPSSFSSPELVATSSAQNIRSPFLSHVPAESMGRRFRYGGALTPALANQARALLSSPQRSFPNASASTPASDHRPRDIVDLVTISQPPFSAMLPPHQPQNGVPNGPTKPESQMQHPAVPVQANPQDNFTDIAQMYDIEGMFQSHGAQAASRAGAFVHQAGPQWTAAQNAAHSNMHPSATSMPESGTPDGIPHTTDIQSLRHQQQQQSDQGPNMGGAAHTYPQDLQQEAPQLPHWTHPLTNNQQPQLQQSPRMFHQHEALPPLQGMPQQVFHELQQDTVPHLQQLGNHNAQPQIAQLPQIIQQGMQQPQQRAQLPEAPVFIPSSPRRDPNRSPTKRRSISAPRPSLRRDHEPSLATTPAVDDEPLPERRSASAPKQLQRNGTQADAQTPDIMPTIFFPPGQAVTIAVPKRSGPYAVETRFPVIGMAQMGDPRIRAVYASILEQFDQAAISELLLRVKHNMHTGWLQVHCMKHMLHLCTNCKSRHLSCKFT